MEDQTETQAVEQGHTAELAALYTGFVNAAVTNLVSNTQVAQASIMMLTDALTNMSKASELPREAYEEIAGEVISYLQTVAMNLSHDIADAVETAKTAAAGEGSNVVQLPTAADATTEVEN